jgi:solute carrier family 4 anion exchanger 2
VAATVRSLTHLISLTNYKMVPIEGGAIRKVPEKVVEQRVTNFGIHLLIGLSLVMAFVLKFVPKSVLLGVFLFMGVSSLNGNELFERMALWPMEASKYPKYEYVQKVASARIHKFTVLQFVCLVILYALKSFKEVAVVFPFFIAALVPIRRSFERFFTPEELEALDGHGEGEDEEDDISPIEELEQPPPVRVASGVSKSSKGSKVDPTVPVVPSQDFAPLKLEV